MFGRFLELSLLTPDTGDAWQQYQQLGFEPAPTGDIWPHAYGVIVCQGLAIGLHAAGEEPLSLAFVRPEVAALHRELTARQLDVEHARLGSDVFNELTLREPGGVALRVLEARTFSPPLHAPQRTGLGRFVSISLPSGELDEAQAFWGKLGLACTPIATPWEGLRIEGMPLTLHPRRILAEPALVFDEAGDQGPVAVSGVTAERPLSKLRGVRHTLLRSAQDLALLLLP